MRVLFDTVMVPDSGAKPGEEDVVGGAGRAAAEGIGVGDHVAGDRVVRAAVVGDAIGQVRLLDRVVAERDAGVGGRVGPDGQAVVAGVADEVVGHGGVR